MIFDVLLNVGNSLLKVHQIHVKLFDKKTKKNTRYLFYTGKQGLVFRNELQFYCLAHFSDLCFRVEVSCFLHNH